MYKKLFTIIFNEKKFLILAGEDYHKTFLEVMEDGNYIYPTYEDYKKLNDIFNNHANRYEITRLFFREKVRYKAAILLILSISGAFITKKVIQSDNEELTCAVYDEISSRDSETLSLIYGNEIVTKEMVIAAIDNNIHLENRYKEIAKKVLEVNLELDPEANLRIFYENVKDLELYEVTKEEMFELTNKSNIDGFYNIPTNKIYIVAGALEQTVAHEFNHIFHEFDDTYNGKKINGYEACGHALIEAMTNKIISYKFGEVNSYIVQGKLLDLFMFSAPNFNYHSYNENGIGALISELKERYPNVDIDYLINYLDALMLSGYDFNLMPLNELNTFSDELFKITLENIDMHDPYKSFSYFINIFDYTDYGFFTDYFSKYCDRLIELNYGLSYDSFNELFEMINNPSISESLYKEYFNIFGEEIIKNGMIDRENFNIVRDASCIIYNKGNFYLKSSSGWFDYYDYDGSVHSADNNGAVFLLNVTREARLKMLNDVIIDNCTVYSFDYIKNLLNSRILYDNNFKSFLIKMARENNEYIDELLEALIKLEGNSNNKESSMFSEFLK